MRTPPHNLEAEQAVLGGLLLDPDSWNRVSWLRAEDFYRGDHQKIFAAIQSIPEGTPADPVTIVSQLGDSLEEIGGQAYIMELVNNTPTTANIHHYAQAVRDKSALRGVISMAGEIADSAFEQEGSVAEVVDSAERRILQVSQGIQGDSDGYADLGDSLKDTLDNLDAAFQARKNGETVGLNTGVSTFDDRFAGLHKGKLIIVAGRPSMGKSALAQTWGRSIAEQGKTVAIHSAEQPREEINHRWLSHISGVPVERFAGSNFSDDDWPRVTRAFGKLHKLKNYLHVHDRSSMRPGHVARLARRLKAQQGLDLLIIDYLQILDAEDSNQDRRLQIDAMSRAFKNLAMELNIPVILVSQLSRKCEERQDKRPMMSDLRESGGIEQDADMIIFPYRPAYYGEDAPSGLAELHVAKNRQGPTGYIECSFIEERAMFADMDRRFGQEAA